MLFGFIPLFISINGYVENMIDNNLFRDLLRYGKIKADFEVKDTMGRYFRVRVFEYQEKKYFTVMCDGEPLELKEV